MYDVSQRGSTQPRHLIYSTPNSSIWHCNRLLIQLLFAVYRLDYFLFRYIKYLNKNLTMSRV